ncbi:hypothetical protein EKG38_10755 [Shewanella canadensis]|uniref:Uncharacterized protein n=1 Tax=Shewanella canadensis TaxID=271096 RepID=A0A3S0INZ2_9GAMM|nr:ETEC_3214 domain-containing protein [Shewanella canadensis]RTR38651.1 hypothetical protein EKG38_10755 [Shewanella canadensis]
MTTESFKSNFIARTKSSWFLLVSLLIGMGQFNDSKDFAISAYEGLSSTMTHWVDYKKINRIDIGISKHFAKSVLGNAKLVKHSSKGGLLEYNYYFSSKFTLGLIYNGGRLSGYWVLSLNDSFKPEIPFSNHSLLQASIKDIVRVPDTYMMDSFNLAYYMEQEQLPRNAMLLKRYLGWVGYGASTEQNNDSAIKQLITSSAPAEQESAMNSKTVELFERARSESAPNLFALGEVDAEQMADSLLTRAEYEYLK